MTPRDRTTTPGVPLRIAFHTLGCRLNQYDTEGLKVALREDRPVEIVAWGDEADLYLLNSCTVTGKADQECRRLARQVKRRRPEARVVVVGCYAQTQPAGLEAVAEIDGVIGNTAKDQIGRWLPAVLASRRENGAPVVLVEDFDQRLEFDSPIIEEFAGRSRAFVKVQDGCDLRCAYCLIWRARGPGRSRPIAGVLEQVARLHEQSGYNELVLTGVHMGSWGRDLGDQRLLDLLEAVCERFPDLRIRLSSIHPNEVSRELLALVARRATLRPHLHLSLQSGSDSVLERMRRPYRSDQARHAMAEAVAVDPHFGLGADVIVGFPGETDAEFADTMGMVEELPFTYLHVFRYSPRPGTPAAELPPVHPEAVTERSRVLRNLAARKRDAFHRDLVGQVREAVVESEDQNDPTRRQATTDNYAAVTVAGSLPAGTLIEVVPESWHDGRLRARVTAVLREVRA